MDNGDGTVTDNQTGLQWEMKTGTVGTAVDCDTTCSDPHDVNNDYRWSSSGTATAADGNAFTDFLSRLNACTSSDGNTVTAAFAGHCDWRLPTIAELRAILDTSQGLCGGGSGACIDPTFGPTAADFYWSSTTLASDPVAAWGLSFDERGETFGFKSIGHFVRAVRGGS